MFRHELARYDIPNEQVQQAAGQRQDGDNFENMGIVSYQHIFSSNVVANFGGMVRDNSNGLSSNLLSTPIIAFQRNHFTEAYFKGTISIHHGNQEWKAGVESDNTFLHEHSPMSSPTPRSSIRARRPRSASWATGLTWNNRLSFRT